jgi:hypothetical protein
MVVGCECSVHHYPGRPDEIWVQGCDYVWDGSWDFLGVCCVLDIFELMTYLTLDPPVGIIIILRVRIPSFKQLNMVLTSYL